MTYPLSFSSSWYVRESLTPPLPNMSIWSDILKQYRRSFRESMDNALTWSFIRPSIRKKRSKAPLSIIFDEGFDCPDVEYIQMARPTLSLAKYLQMVGRGLRVNRRQKDKVCMIIDNVGNYRKFGLPDKERNWKAMYANAQTTSQTTPSSFCKA